MQAHTTSEVKKKRISAEQKRFRAIVRSLNSRITAGVAYLDRTQGRNKWMSKIDERKLDLEDQKTCVLGQVFEDFWKKINANDPDRSYGTVQRKRGLSIKMASSLGFYLYNEEQDTIGYDILTRLWFIRVSLLRIELDGSVLTPPPMN